MAVTVTSITPVSQNADGKIKEVTLSIVLAGTYATGGLVLTAAQKALFGADGKVVWIENDPTNPFALKYNTTTGALQQFGAAGAATAAAEVTAATAVAGTYLVRVHTIGSAVSAPALS